MKARHLEEVGSANDRDFAIGPNVKRGTAPLSALSASSAPRERAGGRGLRKGLVMSVPRAGPSRCKLVATALLFPAMEFAA